MYHNSTDLNKLFAWCRRQKVAGYCHICNIPNLKHAIYSIMHQVVSNIFGFELV